MWRFDDRGLMDHYVSGRTRRNSNKSKEKKTLKYKLKIENHMIRREKKLRDIDKKIWLQLNEHKQAQDWNFIRSFLNLAVTRVLRNDPYVVQKIGPQTTSTAVDHLKPWTNDGYGSLSENNDSDCENIWDQMLNQDSWV